MDPKEIGLHKTNYLLDLVLYVVAVLSMVFIQQSIVACVD